MLTHGEGLSFNCTSWPSSSKHRVYFHFHSGYIPFVVVVLQIKL